MGCWKPKNKNSLSADFADYAELKKNLTAEAAENAEEKINTQIPGNFSNIKIQCPNSYVSVLDLVRLELIWNLVLGVWNFNFLRSLRAQR